MESKCTNTERKVNYTRAARCRFTEDCNFVNNYLYPILKYLEYKNDALKFWSDSKTVIAKQQLPKLVLVMKVAEE